QLEALCAIPGIGSALVSAAGGTCPDSGSGGGVPELPLEQLCAIPGIGPQLASAAGASCGDSGSGGGTPALPGAEVLSPLCALPVL
ncbi:hypothetical protein ABTC46_18555, partial [Acinetobacter baumannii]